MPRISASVIEEIRQLNIVDVVSRHVELARRGRSVTGLCPFHNEKTPSFHVNEDKGFFKCFGCNEAGDAITFIMKYKNLDYVDAVTYITENFGIELKYDEDSKQQQSFSDIKRLNEFFKDYAKESLYGSAGKKGLEYVKSREFSMDTIGLFELGFVPDRVDAAHFESKFKKDILIESGIFYNTQYGLNCFFAGRVLFPIKSATGACVGFSGRSLNPDDRAKYKNSPETPIFAKRKELYNLHNAKDAMKDSKCCYIVEGYFDVMRMVESGYKETVAIMGTAFTKEQITQLKRYTEEYNLLLDGDEAGVRAMNESRRVAIEADIYPKIIILPDGGDPDSIIKDNGVAYFNSILDTGEDLLVHTMRDALNGATDDNKRFYQLEKMKELLKQVQNPYRKERYAQICAELFNVSSNILTSELLPTEFKKPVIVKNYKGSKVEDVCERDFLAALIELSDESIFRIIEDITIEHFNDETSREIFDIIVEFLNRNGTMIGFVNDSAVDKYRSGLLSQSMDRESDPYLIAITNKNQLLLRYLNRLRIQMANELVTVSDPEKSRALRDRSQNILREIRLLQSQNMLN